MSSHFSFSSFIFCFYLLWAAESVIIFCKSSLHLESLLCPGKESVWRGEQDGGLATNGPHRRWDQRLVLALTLALLPWLSQAVRFQLHILSLPLTGGWKADSLSAVELDTSSALSLRLDYILCLSEGGGSRKLVLLALKLDFLNRQVGASTLSAEPIALSSTKWFICQQPGC